MRKDILQTNAKVRLMTTICSIVVYILSFLLLSHFYGQAMAISAVIPAIVVGWYYGCKAGIITAILSFPINILMCAIVGANWWEKMILSGGGIAGTFALILIGAVVGRISDLSIELKRQHEKIKKEINERKRAEEEARGSSIHLKNIFKTSADGILITDGQGCITMINDAVENMLGYSQNELLGKHPEELNSEEEKYKDQARRFYEALTEKGIVIGFERTWQKRDGDLIDIEMSASILRDNEGKQIGGVITLRDITGRKRAEKDIIETRNFLEDVFNTTADGIMVTDSQGCIARVNRAIEQMLGFREDELIGKYTSELGTQEEERVKVRKVMLDQLFEQGYVNNWETMWYRKDRSLCPVEVSITFIKDEEGNRSGSVAAIRDITERKKAEKALQKERDFSNMVIETADVLITGVDLEGKIFLFNRKAEEVTGWSREEVMGKDFAKVLIPERGRTPFIQLIKEIKEGKTINPLDAHLLTKNGEKRIVISRGTPLKNIEGEIVGILGIGLDVTGSRKMEQQLLQSEKLKSLGELSGGVAHDFNNVLAAILGRVQLLRMQFKPPEGKQEKRKSMLDLIKSLEIIERASLDGAETVRRIQEFSRKRVDDKEFTKIDMNELVDNALEFTSVRWKNDAESKGIKINIQKEFSPLPPTSGSASELREVFTNLIHNAIDAMPKGGRIKIKTFKENGHISIKVEDTGVGISEAISNRIFDPFFTTKGVQSTGLGMSISYGIINRHGGTIRVDSMEGKGSTFTITLPISDNIRVEEEKTKPLPEEKRKSTILVIEDEEEVRNLLADILIENGHQVETASDGNQGIDKFKKKAFDMVFTDLGMPGTSGWEVAETVKGINDRVPIALITGWNVELNINMSEMKDAWIDFVVQKPFEMNQILKLVQEGMVLRDQFKAA